MFIQESQVVPRSLKDPSVRFYSCVLFFRSSVLPNNSALYYLGTFFAIVLITLIYLLNGIYSYVASPVPLKCHSYIQVLRSRPAPKRSGQPQTKHQCHTGGPLVSSAPPFSSSSSAVASSAPGALASTVPTPTSTTTTTAPLTLANGMEESPALLSAPS